MKKLILYSLVLFLGTSCGSQKRVSFPQFVGYVNDFDNLFSRSEQDSLTAFISRYEDQTTNQIAIVTLNSIEPYTDIQKYATDLGNEWGIGQEKQDNGLMIEYRFARVNIDSELEIGDGGKYYIKGDDGFIHSGLYQFSGNTVILQKNREPWIKVKIVQAKDSVMVVRIKEMRFYEVSDDTITLFTGGDMDLYLEKK